MVATCMVMWMSPNPVSLPNPAQTRMPSVKSCHKARQAVKTLVKVGRHSSRQKHFTEDAGALLVGQESNIETLERFPIEPGMEDKPELMMLQPHLQNGLAHLLEGCIMGDGNDLHVPFCSQSLHQPE